MGEAFITRRGGTGGGGGILTGTTPPSASLGNDGDVYKQTFPIPASINFVSDLTSSGTQYINTGIIATEGTDVVCDLTYRGNDFIVGNRTGSATAATKSLMVTGTGSGLSIYKSQTSGTIATYATSATSGNRYKSAVRTFKSGSAKFWNLFPVLGVCTGVKTGTFTADYPQALFGCFQGSTVTKASSCTLHRVTYNQDGVPSHDYLPALDSNNVACMWDNVSQEYVYNDGTGVFAYDSVLSTPPAELDPVYYVKLNGAWEIIA